VKTSEFLAHLQGLSIRVRLESGELKVSAPKGALTADLKTELGARKQEILALLGTAEESATPNTLPPIARIDRSGDLPLSYTQQRLWFLDQLEPGILTYNMWVVCRMHGPLVVDALERAVNEIVRRHEVLRTTFPDDGGVPTQAIAPFEPLALEIVSSNGQTLDDGAIQALLHERVERLFDLKRGPMVRPTLVRVSDDDHVFLVALHHAVFDGVSKSLFFRELTALYEAFTADRPSPLAELPIQYADYSSWQRELFEDPRYGWQMDYWKEVLAGDLPVLALPFDKPRPPLQTHSGTIAWRRLPLRLIDDLERIGNPVGATLFVVLLAAYKAFLRHYTGQTDLLVGTAVAGRNRAEIEPLMGFFVNTIVLRTGVEDDPTFRELVTRVRDVSLGALQHQEMPFQLLVDEVQPNRDMSVSPLFQTLFILDEDPGDERSMGALELSNFNIENPVTRTDLVFTGYRGRDGFVAWLEYNTDLFEHDTIVRMLANYERMLFDAVQNPDRPISELAVLADEERRQVVVDWNETKSPYPAEPIHVQFEQQVDRTPAATALIYPDPDGSEERVTYGALDERANRLANHLIAQGVARGDLVGLCLDRSAEMVVAQLAILKTGAAYVPLDPAFPAERLAYMVSDAQLSLVVTTSELASLLPTGTTLSRLDDVRESVAAADPARPDVGTELGERMYVIYTSGSTGKPKGVELEHRSVSNFLASMAREPGLEASDSLLAVTTLSFDISVLELFLPLTRGATVIVASKQATGDGELLSQHLETYRPTVMQATPATWHMLMLAGWEGSADMRILVGGEAVPRELANELAERGREAWNVYGPTEATVWSTTARIEPGSGPVSIGRPIGNTRIYVLDSRRRPVPIGVTGELWIAGDGLARGYLERPELTAERFVDDPFETAPGERMYLTGDLARWHEGGTLECLGRTDNQVKLRGYRIELGEIETVLAEEEGVEQAVCVIREDTPGDQRLTAYWVRGPGGEPTTESLRARGSSALPAYMVPAAFVELDALPLTPNKKVDRKALLARDSDTPTVDAAAPEHVAPRNELESSIAGIWGEVLGLANVPVHTNFFDLGGHSLLLAQVRVRLAETLERPIPIIELFQYPTVAALATHLGTGEKTRAPDRQGRSRALSAGRRNLRQRRRSR
jgi:amino acid adenylation domain-containing protein